MLVLHACPVVGVTVMVGSRLKNVPPPPDLDDLDEDNSSARTPRSALRAALSRDTFDGESVVSSELTMPTWSPSKTAASNGGRSNTRGRPTASLHSPSTSSTTTARGARTAGSRGGRASASTVDHGDERASAAAPLYRAKTAFEATEHWQLSLARGDALLLFDADRCVAVAVVIASG